MPSSVQRAIERSIVTREADPPDTDDEFSHLFLLGGLNWRSDMCKGDES